MRVYPGAEFRITRITPTVQDYSKERLLRFAASCENYQKLLIFSGLLTEMFKTPATLLKVHIYSANLSTTYLHLRYTNTI